MAERVTKRPRQAARSAERSPGDRNDINENLADLAEHVAQGNEALIQQDLAVLQRSIQNVRGDANDVQASAWDGFAEGIQECATD